MSNQPAKPQDPQTEEEFSRRGWTLYVEGDYERAEADFRSALAIDNDSIEANYGLALVRKGKGDNEGARPLFERVINLVNEGGLEEDRSRASMLRHLSETHLSYLSGQPWQAPAE